MNETYTGGGASGVAASSPQSQGMGQDLKAGAKDIGRAAQDKIESKAEAGKDQASQAVRSTSSALNTAVEALRNKEGTPSWLTSALETGSRELEKFAGGLESKDLQTIRRDVGQFARQNPAVFLAAAAAVGFAAARVLRAGSEHRQTDTPSSQLYGTDTDYTSSSAARSEFATDTPYTSGLQSDAIGAASGSDADSRPAMPMGSGYQGAGQ